jgi:hypothetical protein
VCTLVLIKCVLKASCVHLVLRASCAHPCSEGFKSVHPFVPIRCRKKGVNGKRCACNGEHAAGILIQLKQSEILRLTRQYTDIETGHLMCIFTCTHGHTNTHTQTDTYRHLQTHTDVHTPHKHTYTHTCRKMLKPEDIFDTITEEEAVREAQRAQRNAGAWRQNLGLASIM